MEDDKLKELHEKLDRLLSEKKEKKSTPEWLHFMFQAALPIALGVFGFYFTYQYNENQLAFQKIGVADNLMNEVTGDTNFTKDKLDLKLGFVEKVFDDQRFKDTIKALLTQTYLVNLSEHSAFLTNQAATGDPTAVAALQKQINQAKQFNDPKINNAVKNIENTDPVKKINKAEDLKQSAMNDLKNGNVDSAAAKLDQANQLLPKDTTSKHLATSLRYNRSQYLKDPNLAQNRLNNAKQVQPVPLNMQTPADTSKKGAHQFKKKPKQP